MHCYSPKPVSARIVALGDWDVFNAGDLCFTQVVLQQNLFSERD